MIFRKLCLNNAKYIRYINKQIMAKNRYVWIDLEMTGLDVNLHTILEIACIITTPDIEILHEGLNLVIHQPDEVLETMSSWCMKQHYESGLVKLCRKSNMSLEEADTKVSEYIKQHCDPDGIRYLAGNSVHIDKIFLEKYMPNVFNLLHYQILDVSVLKILCSHWYPEVYKNLCKKSSHKALVDILESINELKYYKSTILG